MMLFQPSPIINGRIRHLLPSMPPHQRSIWAAVLRGCTYAQVIQGDGAFRIPTGRPAVVVVGDDLHVSRGPGGFHRRSLDRYLSRCMRVCVVSGEALAEVYGPIVMQAIDRRHDVAIIETRPAHEADWLAWAKRAAPLATVTLSKPEMAGRSH